ncbi:Rieske (2Fe-2S) protein [Chloroflexota bacterium]
MSQMFPVAVTGDFENAPLRKVNTTDRSILIARVDNGYFSVDAVCSHLRGDLYKGKLEGSVINCPRHGARFDMTNGHFLGWPEHSGRLMSVLQSLRAPKNLNTYPVKAADGKIHIKI